MQRTTAVTVGLLFALGIALVLMLGRSESRPVKQPSLRPSTSASIAPRALVASAMPSASAAPNDAGMDEREGAFDTLPDGRKVPELPDSAPKTVTFGVVLVTYQGAQSAPSDARSKADAEKRAKTLLDEAKRDFAAAVTHGDRGSRSDMGRIPRGILEPVVEYLLFTLEKGNIYPEPIDTPRGFWIIRRND